MSAKMKPEPSTLDRLVLHAIRAASRPLSVDELREATGRIDLDPMNLFLMIEDGLIYPTDRNRSRAKYFIRGEASEPEPTDL